jgi:CMP-N,N'-diacetyllegionaminic acid synthase
MRIDAIILARGGSKGIPKKNIINFCGKPLVFWTIKQCLASKKISNVWVSSDSDEILEISKNYGAQVIKRPHKISGDTDSSESAWIHAINFIESESVNRKIKIDYVVAPQVTSPIREAVDFDDSIEQIINDNSDSLLSVTSIEDFFIWKKLDGKNPESVNYNYKDRKPRQQIDKRYVENGSFYIFKPFVLKENNNRLGGAISFFIMDKHKMFQIDDVEDIKLSSLIMKGFELDYL